MLTGGKSEEIFAGYLRQITDTCKNILDIGTSQRFAKELRPYESWFDRNDYIAAGYQPILNYGAYNCDCHQDIENMTFDDMFFDAVICLEVLEHCKNPYKGVKEINRVLREHGFVLLTVPFLLQYHGKGSKSHNHESYPDFWRFTHEGLDCLFSDFKEVEIVPLGGPIEFRLQQFYLSKHFKNLIFRKFIDFIDTPKLGKATTRHLVFAIK